MTADTERLRGMLADDMAEALYEAPLAWDFFPDPDAAIETVIDALLPVVAREIAAAEQRAAFNDEVRREQLRMARAEALREAAKEAEERGDIGKDGGPDVWEWLRFRAGQVGGCEACPYAGCRCETNVRNEEGL